MPYAGSHKRKTVPRATSRLQSHRGPPYRIHPEQRQYAPATFNLGRRSARGVRGGRCWAREPGAGAGIPRVKGVRRSPVGQSEGHGVSCADAPTPVGRDEVVSDYALTS
jgi:hypothetical protein